MRTLTLPTLLLLSLSWSCGPSEVAVEEAGRSETSAVQSTGLVAPSAPVDLGDGLLLEVTERGTGDFVRAGGRVRVHYRARALPVAAPQAEPAAESEAPEPEAIAEELLEEDEAEAEAVEVPEQDPAPAEEPEATAMLEDVTEGVEDEPAAAPASTSREFFDSSYTRGVPDVWDLSSTASPRLIEGLRRGLVGLTAGSHVTLSIPAALAWGDEGLTAAGVPPRSDVRYEIEILEVLP